MADERQWKRQIEESAEGSDFFRTPGDGLMLEDARERAEAAGWIPESPAAPRSKSKSDGSARRERLRSAAQALESSLAHAAGSNGWRTTVAACVATLASVIDDHVEETEAAGGLLEVIRTEFPRLDHAIRRLERQHAELRVGCADLLDLLRGEVDCDAVRWSALQLLGAISRHRQEGADLLFDAYDTDIGASG